MNNQLPALGEPLPASKHAVSVSLPAWADVVGYEEADPRVINAMKTGYPRFVYNSIVKKLFAAAEKKFAKAGEFALAFPSERIAKLAQKFCQAGRVERFSGYAGNIYALILPKGLEKTIKAFWQHAGFIVSSRQAEAELASSVERLGTSQTPDARRNKANTAKSKIRKHLANLTGEAAENIYLFPSGMAAIFSAFEITAQNKTTVQLGFPYVDTLKIQEKFGHKTVFISNVADLDQLETTIKNEKPAVVFTEFPTNPLITCVDLERLSAICRTNKVALVIDDTLSSWANVDTISYADIVVSSLTKFFSGVGDVLAGSLILNAKSPLYKTLKTKLDNIYEDLLFSEDAIVLEKNSRDFAMRFAKINDNAEQLADYLKTKTTVYYTKGNPLYEKYKTGGYGGIISIVLPNEKQAIKFYDALEVNKGPSLGTNYTLACPYTLLAHYHEREFAENSGVPFHLIRVSVGLEDISGLKKIFEKAFS